MPDINKSSNLGDTAEISSMNTSAAKNHATDSIVLERISPHSRIEDPFVTINRNEISFPDGKNGKKIIPLALIENITANEQCVGKDSCDHISCGILRRAINMHEIAVVVQGIQRRGEPDGEFSKFEVLTRVEKEPGSGVFVVPVAFMHNLDSYELVSDFDVAVFETGFAKIVEYFGEEAKEMEFSFNAFPQTLMNDEKRWKIIQLIRSYAGTFHLNIEIVEDHNKGGLDQAPYGDGWSITDDDFILHMGRLNCAIHEIRSFCPEVRFSLDDFPNMHNSVRTLHTIDFMDVVKIDGDWIKLKIEKCKEEYGEDGYLEAFREDLRNMIELIRTSHNNCEIVVEKIENEDIRAIFEGVEEVELFQGWLYCKGKTIGGKKSD